MIICKMEIRRAADALLRSQAFPLASFLTPSLASRCQPTRQLAARSAINSIARTFTSASRSLASKTSITTSAPGSREKVDDFLEQSKSLWSAPNLRKGGNSRILNDINSSVRPTFKSEGSAAFAKMLDVKSKSNTSTSLDMMKAAAQTSHALPQQPKIPMRLTPSTGRTVMIGAGVDIGRGFRLLEQSCARNKVRSDFTRQRFHERGGLKRKRLRRERWRKRFLLGFQATVGRVKELRRQGW